MEKIISNISKKLSIARTESYYRRINWLSFIERVQLISEEIKNNKESYKIGEFYFRTNEDTYRNTSCSNYIFRMNQAQFWIGNRPVIRHRLGLDENPNSELRYAFEGKASLVFSQSPDGRVAVLLYPMRCELVEDSYKPKILAFKKPNDLTISKIRKYFKIYLQYIYVTSIDSRFSYCNFKFRFCLTCRDFLIRLPLKEYFNTVVGIIAILGVGSSFIGTILAFLGYFRAS